MSAPAPSPMPTPDLAAILRRPRTATAASPTPPEAGAQVDPPLNDRDIAATPDPPRELETAAPRPQAAAPRTSGPTPTGQAAAPATRAYTRLVQLQLPRSLHQALHAAKTEQNTTATALILTALSTAHDRLGDHLPTAAPDTGAGLFPVPQARRRAEPTQPTNIRATDAQLTAIDELRRRYGDVDRSALVTAALRAYL